MNDYFYLDEQNKQQGPIAADRLTAHGVNSATLVWTQGMTDWAPAGSIPELKTYFEKRQQDYEEYKDETQQTQQNEPNGSNSQFNQGYNTNNGSGFNGGFNNGNPFGGPRPDNRPPYPETHMAGAILATICCCLPFGIVAIVKANQVSSLYAQGLYDAAYLAADDARKWTIISVVCGIISMSCGSLFAFL